MPRLFFFCLGFFSFILCSGQAFKINPVARDSSMYESPDKVIHNIQIVGNQVTKSQIILRELTFSKSDTLENEAFIEALIQSKKNLLNTSLFNFVKIDYALLDPREVFIVIQVEERWYTFPLPIFEIDDNNFNTWWKDKDFSRINYGGLLVRNNFRGRKEKLSLIAQFGFTERFRLQYEVPYINKSQKSGLKFKFSYNRRDEIVYTTLANERLQYKDEDQDAVRNYAAGVDYTYRGAIFNQHTLGFEYDFNSIVDTVAELNPNYLGRNQVESQFISLYYNFTHDNRDSRNYPLIGNYLSVSLRKYGLGLLGSEVDLTNFQFQAKKFWDLQKRFYFSSSIRGVIAANNNQPYLLQNGLGYSSSFNIRSYEYYVIDGQNIGLAKAQLRYQLVKPNSMQLDFVPVSRFNKFHYAFYLGLFSDIGYVEDNIGFPQNDLANEVQYGLGISLDFVTYYDTVIRSEFSINKFGESGFFLHFVAPI
ncbi:MAG: POTRA domain-containing protein [Vicingaceae bacterium]